MNAATGSPEICSLGQRFDQFALAHANRIAIDFLGRSYRYSDLARLVDRAALGFARLGVGKGVRVGLCLPNSPYHVVCFYAVMKLGGVVVNFNPLYTEREMRHQVSDSGTRIMVTLDLQVMFPKVAALQAAGSLDTVVVCPMAGILPPIKSLAFRLLKRKDLAQIPAGSAFVSYRQLTGSSGKPQPVAINPLEDVAVLQYTGGTTGVPKGAMLTHHNIDVNAQQTNKVLPVSRTEQEVVLGALPMFHVFAMTLVMHYGLSLGAKLLLLPRFDLAQVLALIGAKRPTLFPGVPTIYNAINEAARKAKYDLSSIRYCISGGAPLPPEVYHQFEKLTGCKLVEGYGLSEASPVVSCNPFEGLRKDGSIGLPLPWTEVELQDPATGLPVTQPGVRGEVCVRGPQVMKGYWNRPDDTRAVFSNGALRTGDIGYRDEDGYLFIVDRIKDLIICSGFNVYPRVIEDVLYEHPAVAEAVVIAIKDAYRGQAPKAFVRLKDGVEITPDELNAYLASQISKIEMPKEIEIRDQLPKTMIGKLSKKELVAEEEARASTGG